MSINLTGLSITNTRHPIKTYHQLGGPGLVLNKALAIPAHLGQPWHSVEYVFLPPGRNGVGEHRQATDEIYLILSGRGELVTNGEPALVEAGTLATAPAGTVHALTNASTTEPLELLVVELTIPAGASVYTPSRHHLLQEMREAHAFHPVYHGDYQLVCPRFATADLRHAFSSAFQSLSLIELLPGSHVEPYIELEHDQLLFVVRGFATFTIPQQTEPVPEYSKLNLAYTSDRPTKPITVLSDDQSHQSVLVPRGVPCGWENRASGEAFPLLMALLTVRSEHERQARPSPISTITQSEQTASEVIS